MQKVFILVLLLSLLHRPSAYTITVSSNSVTSASACTTNPVVGTDEVALDHDPRTVYEIDMCLVYSAPEGHPETTMTACPGAPRPSTFEFEILSGEPAVKKTVTMTSNIPAPNNPSQVCVSIPIERFITEYANQDFYNVRVKTTITVNANLNGGSVVAAIKGGTSKFKAAGIYMPAEVPMFTVYTVLCHDVPHCVVTAAKTGDVVESDPIYLGIVSKFAPVVKTGVDAVVNANTFMAKSFRCNSGRCRVAVTVTDGTPKAPSGEQQNTN